ncbi:hypothetical protein BD414DRAFT_540744 [Trametes punicea]|nr:hypothetical protein BD414DRAFT_540744 [Trametes punicea]
MSTSISSILRGLGIPSLNASLGAVYLGVVIGVMFYGLTVHQSYRYYKLYPTDRPYIKVLVSVIIFLESLHTMLWIFIGFHYTISESFNLTGTLKCHWTVRSTFILTSMAVYSCQTFYCCRVYLTFGFVAGVEAFLYVREIVDLHRVSWKVSAAYGFAVSSDLILTGALVFVLHRSRTESKRTNSILDVLIIYTINTGLLTSIVSLLAFLFALVLPGNLIYAGVSIVGAKLYANSVLALLNSRRSIDNRFMDDFTTFSVPDLTSSTFGGGTTSRLRRGESDTMVWNVQQVSTVRSVTTSVSQGMSFATEPSSEAVEVANG